MSKSWVVGTCLAAKALHRKDSLGLLVKDPECYAKKYTMFVPQGQKCVSLTFWERGEHGLTCVLEEN